MIQHWLTCVFKMPGSCCFSDKGNKILFRINSLWVNQGFDLTPQEEIHWCKVQWAGRPSHRPAPPNPAIVGHTLLRQSLWLILHNSLLLPYTVLQANWMSASLAYVKHSMLVLIWPRALVWFWVRFSKLTLQACHKQYQKQLTCLLVEWVACIPVTSPTLTVCSAPRTLHQKFDLSITNWFCRGFFCPYFEAAATMRHLWAYMSISAVPFLAFYSGQCCTFEHLL
jgi:hypothetical protein